MNRSESGYKVEKKTDIAANCGYGANGVPVFSKITVNRKHTEDYYPTRSKILE